MTSDVTRRDVSKLFLIAPATISAAIAISSRADAVEVGSEVMSVRKTALILIDVQNDYFPGGRFPLENMPVAAEHCAALLAAFRKHALPIVHVRHENLSTNAPFFVAGSEGARTHASVAPLEGEPVVVKHFPNSFRETNLKAILDGAGIEALAICGAMSNMCVDAGTRAAADYGYTCSVAHDACAAMTINFQGVKVPPAAVHAAFMGALSLGYAKVARAEEILKDLPLS